MMGYVWNQGSLVMLDRLANYIRRHRSGAKAEALRSLREYVAKRVNMTDYPSYRQMGYDCGSGPTGSFCGTLTARLEGRGMRRDKDNPESITALGSLYYANLWQHYWNTRRAAWRPARKTGRPRRQRRQGIAFHPCHSVEQAV